MIPVLFYGVDDWMVNGKNECLRSRTVFSAIAVTVAFEVLLALLRTPEARAVLLWTHGCHAVLKELRPGHSWASGGCHNADFRVSVAYKFPKTVR